MCLPLDGNAETNNNDDGAGTMECIYFGTCKIWGYGNGTGPWVRHPSLKLPSMIHSSGN